MRPAAATRSPLQAGCALKNVSCPLHSQAEQVVVKLEGFFEWAKIEPRIAGKLVG